MNGIALPAFNIIQDISSKSVCTRGFAQSYFMRKTESFCSGNTMSSHGKTQNSTFFIAKALFLKGSALFDRRQSAYIPTLKVLFTMWPTASFCKPPEPGCFVAIFKHLPCLLKSQQEVYGPLL